MNLFIHTDVTLDGVEGGSPFLFTCLDPDTQKIPFNIFYAR